MWGQDIWQFSINGAVRIIPTRVGTRVYLTLKKHTTKDHPHACGDKLYKSLHCPSDTGSSPRVWGQDSFSRALIVAARIIPTRVGTRTFNFSVKKFNKDHPHACGDKADRPRRHGVLLGSSPRVWGQEHQQTLHRRG